MKLNNKGNSMLELLAVIFIASAVIFPMVSSLVTNIETNARYHNRRSAVSIAQSTVEGFDRIDFNDMQTLVNTANSTSTYYVEFDFDNCNVLSASDQAFCEQLFDATWSNFTADTSTFRVYVFNYNLTTTMKSSLVSNANLPQRVRDQINTYTTTNNPNPDLYHIIAWVVYDSDTSSAIIVEGLISNE
jgi:hypothetical protein